MDVKLLLWDYQYITKEIILKKLEEFLIRDRKNFYNDAVKSNFKLKMGIDLNTAELIINLKFKGLFKSYNL